MRNVGLSGRIPQSTAHPIMFYKSEIVRFAPPRPTNGDAVTPIFSVAPASTLSTTALVSLSRNMNSLPILSSIWIAASLRIEGYIAGNRQYRFAPNSLNRNG